MNGLLAAQLLTLHKGQAGSGPLSPRLWSKARSGALTPDGSGGSVEHFDDFTNFGKQTVTSVVGESGTLGSGYHAYIEVDATPGSIENVAGKPGGVIKLLTSTDSADGDNHDTVLTTGGNVGTLGAISDTAGDDKLTIFEARIQLPSVTDGDGSVFVGLGEEGLAAANTPIVDSTGHTLSSDDLIGFFVGEDDNDALKFVYRKNGAALQTVLTYGTALAADTWYNVGFVYDPKAPESNRISIFVNNVEQSTYVTATNIAASTFPDGEHLALVAAIKASANADAQSVLMDSWAFYQAR